MSEWKPDWEEGAWEVEDRMAYLVSVLGLLTVVIAEQTTAKPYPKAYLKQDLERAREIAMNFAGGFEDEHLEHAVLERFSQIIDQIEKGALKVIEKARGGCPEMN